MSYWQLKLNWIQGTLTQSREMRSDLVDYKKEKERAKLGGKTVEDGGGIGENRMGSGSDQTQCILVWNSQIIRKTKQTKAEQILTSRCSEDPDAGGSRKDSVMFMLIKSRGITEHNSYRNGQTRKKKPLENLELKVPCLSPRDSLQKKEEPASLKRGRTLQTKAQPSRKGDWKCSRAPGTHLTTLNGATWPGLRDGVQRRIKGRRWSICHEICIYLRKFFFYWQNILQIQWSSSTHQFKNHCKLQMV